MSNIPPQQLREPREPHSMGTSRQFQLHTPVLLEAVLSYLCPIKGATYLDLTAGYGGHARAVIERLGNDASLATLVDQDAMAERELAPLIKAGARFMHSDFVSAAIQLVTEGQHYDMILADLGVSSPQLDRAERGFSFMKKGPLDMRMDQRMAVTAADIVNQYPEAKLREIIRLYGEEPRARTIAAAIISHRPFTTTEQLAQVIAEVVPRRGKIHPATRTFQALRIELNQEIDQIKRLLPLLPRLLSPGGRVAIISFHSLEDREVKRYFSEQAKSGYEAELELLTKKPLSGALLDVTNPRARSAKLRVAAKIKREGAKTDDN